MGRYGNFKPKAAKGNTGANEIAHGEHFDEYGRIIQDPTTGIDPSGKKIRIDHLEQSPEEKKKNKATHKRKYHS